MASLTDLQVPIERHKFWFQYITTPTSDTPGTTLLLHFDNKRYLFGRVAEGTQRACIERGVALKKARNIFLTGETTWETNGGLLGMILTMADFQVETNEEEQQALGNIQIHGGPKLWHSIACARRFIFRTGMPIKVQEANPEKWKASQQPDFVDENILLWALPVENQTRGYNVPELPNGRSSSPNKIEQEQSQRRETVHNMFNSDWRKDRLSEAMFKDVNLPAMVWVRDSQTKKLSGVFCAQMSDAPHISPDQTVLARLPWPAALVADLPSADNLPGSVAMSYLIKGRPQRGQFDPKKAKDLGVPKGPSFGVLAGGGTITLEHGRVIKPEEVMEPVLPGYGTAVLDIPDVQYLSDLVQKLNDMRDVQALNDYQSFLWTLGPGVLGSEAFSDVLQHFPSVKHIIASPDDTADYLVMTSFAASACRLNQIRPEIYLIPKHNNTRKQIVDYRDNLLQADRGMQMQVAPRFEVDRTGIPAPLDINARMADVTQETKALIPSDTKVDTAPADYDDISITTLGTGSAMPSKYRNVSANLVHIPSLGYVLLDCGEDTLGQLKRLYDAKELEDLLCNLHMVWISHLHADHHLGTVSVLVARRDAVRKREQAGTAVSHKLYIISEPNMVDYLLDYKSLEDTGAVMISCLNSEIKDITGGSVSLQDLTMPVTDLRTTRVSHCRGAQGVSITFSNGFKISYSGDCRPSAAFAQIGKDSDVLIHEATFDDGMEGDAAAKKHCTIGEALGVADAMRAKNVILTHFSQRYQKLPTLRDVKFPSQLKFEEGDDTTDPIGAAEPKITNGVDEVATALTPMTGTLSSKKENSLQETAQKMSVCIAFDLMRVTVPQIKNVYKYYPAIEHMFEVEEQRSEKRKEGGRAVNQKILEEKERKAEEKRNAHRPKKPKNKNMENGDGQSQVKQTPKGRRSQGSGPATNDAPQSLKRQQDDKFPQQNRPRSSKIPKLSQEMP